MSTRSIVYGHTESGIKGVYVHFDGYPEGRLPVLAKLIQRDGVDRVMSTILAQTWGWSSLDANPVPPELPPYMGDGRFELVTGYGVRYTKDDGGEPDYRDTSQQARDIFIEYVYVVEQDGSISYATNQDVPWDDLAWESTALAGA
jgi:hypothetical protein